MIDATADRDRRVWHLAAAGVGPDVEVASELEALAVRARSRGGHGVAGAALTRSAQLTQDEERRAGRQLAAAEEYQVVGAPTRADALLMEAVSGAAGSVATGLGAAAARIDPLRDGPRRRHCFDLVDAAHEGWSRSTCTWLA